MTRCEECGKKLRFFEGYQHPTMGDNNLLCSGCFDTVSESVEKWKEFVISNSFKNESSKYNLQSHKRNIPLNILQKKKIFDNVLIENKIEMR